MYIKIYVHFNKYIRIAEAHFWLMHTERKKYINNGNCRIESSPYHHRARIFFLIVFRSYIMNNEDAETCCGISIPNIWSQIVNFSLVH